MFFCYIFLFVPLLTFLHDVRVFSCNYSCADKPVFTPSRLVVKYGDPTSANCSVCQDCLNKTFGLEKSLGEISDKTKTPILWTVDRMSEWDITPICYYSFNNSPCCSKLPVTVYKPPHNVAISFVDHSGPMLEGHQYTLQCTVQDVAPVKDLTVTFYKGHTALGQLQSNNTEKKPVNETFTLNIIPSNKDDGVQYWCEAKLELGPEGPRRPPVVMSQNITATVYYKPHLEESLLPKRIIISEGDLLQLNCSALGNPSPSYSWTLPSDSPPPSSDGVLTIKSVAVEHEGQYICSVGNNVGTITVNYTVEVQVSYTMVIILGVIIGAVVVAVLLGMFYHHYYRHNRMGKYNLKDVLRLSTRHSALPTVE
ncbi:intercellular adhesion molecule 1-like isoform X1 [Micropterus salmoides]|uniref:intercellular adhesion molecule 1-like isoform X1 n=1 Tax=Micropterus salmoides TaxID=27706 RepID=UPI0018EAC758|nr:intercellular adhesion molecule 1-like isoform X1 [Micropterus salmoides]